MKRLLSKFDFRAVAITCVLSIGCVISIGMMGLTRNADAKSGGTTLTSKDNAVGKSVDRRNPQEPLNEAVIQRLFAYLKSGVDNKHHKLENIKIAKGNFVDDKSISAIVSYNDTNASHADGWGKLWLLTYDSGWKLKREITAADYIKFKIINIGKDVKSAVWIEKGVGGQGEEYFEGDLMLLGQNNDEKLYDYSGNNSCATLRKDADFDEHEVEFKDIDGDGVLEIMDTEKKGKCNKDGDPIVKQTIKSVYKFNGKKYVKIK